VGAARPSARKRGRRQPSEKAPRQAAAIIEDDARGGPASNVTIWNHS
jgi:hypothetical protein